MKPGSQKRSLIFETQIELDWAKEAAYKLRLEHPGLEERFEVSPPEELTSDEVALVIEGLSAILTRQHLTQDLEPEARQVLSDLQSMP